MRYVMRIAESVNHQIFERILRFRVNWKHSCLSVCSSFSLNLNGLWAHYVQNCMFAWSIWVVHVFEHPCLDKSLFNMSLKADKFVKFTIQTSNQERRPPGFKHITKGRKRN